MKYQNLKRIVQCLITAPIITYTIGCASSRSNQGYIEFFNEFSREYERIIEKELGPKHPHDFRLVKYSDIARYKSIIEIVDRHDIFENMFTGLFTLSDPIALEIIGLTLATPKTPTHEEANTWTKYKGTITNIITEENKGHIPDKQEYPFVSEITIETDNGNQLRIKIYSSDQEGVDYTINSRFPIGRNLELEVLEGRQDPEGFYETWKVH